MKPTTQNSLTNVLVHLPAVDEALPILMNQLEELQVLVLNGEETKSLERIFTAIATLAVTTFRREEEAMELCHDQSSYPHKMAHQKFLKTFAAIKSKCLSNGPSVDLAQDIRNDLVRWLVDHHRLMNASLGRTVFKMVERSRAHHESTAAGISSTD